MNSKFSILIIALFAVASVKSQCSSLVTFSASNFIGSLTKVHVNFQPYLQRVSQLATNCNAKVYVTSSFRRPGAPISGAVVPPASSSNHFVGYAIDFNLTPSSSNAIGCNSACLGGAVSAMPAYAQCFTQGISGLGLRWGKSFNPTDPVHIDYPLNLNNPSQYISITNSVVNC